MLIRPNTVFIKESTSVFVHSHIRTVRISMSRLSFARRIKLIQSGDDLIVSITHYKTFVVKHLQLTESFSSDRHMDISHMPITELENDSESIWVKVFANKTSHFVASWYRQPGSTSEEFQLFREQLDYIRTHHKGKTLPSAHVQGDFNFKDIDWPDRLSKSGSTLSQSEGQILIDIMNDHGLEQMVHFPTREKNTLDLILTTLPGQFQDVHSL